jgi:hypothetical protein
MARRCQNILPDSAITAPGRITKSAALSVCLSISFLGEFRSLGVNGRIANICTQAYGQRRERNMNTHQAATIREIREDGKLMHNWAERASWEVYSALARG